MNPKRGEIVLCSLDPVIGKEISKKRPVLIVSNDTSNKFSGTVTVLPITFQKVERSYPFEVLLELGAGNLDKRSKVKADQIRNVDKSRCIARIGEHEEEDMKKTETALKIHLGLRKKIFLC